MSIPDVQQYGPVIAPLLTSAPEMGLTFGPPDSVHRSALEGLTASSAFEPHTVADDNMARCCLSALWLAYDHMERSHELSQAVPTSSGSYWHAILHRREPDAGNAKYWFGRVGDHAIFPDLAAAAAELAGEVDVAASAWLTSRNDWDPFKFIDLCETARTGSDESLQSLCRRVQMREFYLLFDYCYRAALGR